MADCPMSTPRRSAPRSIGAPMIRTFLSITIETLPNVQKSPVPRVVPCSVCVLRADALDALGEVDLGLPAGRLVHLRGVGTRVVDVDVLRDRILDVLGVDVRPEFVVEHLDDRIET